MMIVQTQHILPMAHGLDMERWKNYMAHNLVPCSPFLRAVVRVGRGGDSLREFESHLVLIALYGGSAETPWVN